MARRNLSAVVRYLRQLTNSAGDSTASDAELLERYVRRRDEAAFELLLWRHGALVFNVCRRILPREQDAEDAFQATFLAFVRKAGSISRRGSVASWLYKVAYRVALEAREKAKKTAAVEKPGGEILAVPSTSDPSWSDVRPILDEELNRLPEHLRRPLLLCYLEGKSNEEAAKELGCRLGTIYSRLSRGREILRHRLLRRGVTLSITGLTAHAVEAAPAISLMRSAARAALAFADPSAAVVVSPRVTALAEGVLRTMFVTKLKIVAVMLFVVSLAAGGGVLTHGWTAAPQAEAQTEDTAPKREDDRKAETKPIAVKVVKPKRGGTAEMLIQPADVAATQLQHLLPLVSGTVKEVAVDIGDRVKKGQVLIVLDAPLLAKDVEQAEAALEMAQARAEEAQATVNSAQEKLRQALSVRSEVARAQAALKAAKANVRLAQVALAKTRIQEGFMRLRAEFDGVVAERKCDPGNFVQGGEGRARQPLLTLVRMDRLRVTVPLTPHFARVVERGDPVELSAEGVSQIGIEANGTSLFELQGDRKDFIIGQKIARISPIFEGVKRTRSVIIDVENPNNRLVPGMPIGVRIHFNKTRKPNAFTLPRSCVFALDAEESYVYIVRDGKAHRRQVTIGYLNLGEDECDVIEGIKESDLVITTEPEKLHEGAPVKVEKMP